MKNILVTGLLSAAFLNPAIGYAEDYLFPTDIVPEGKFDAIAGIQESTNSRAVGGSLFGLRVRFEERRETTAEIAGIRYGLTPDLHIGLEAPYRSRDELQRRTKPGSDFAVRDAQDTDGADNLRLFARYRLLNKPESRLSLVANAEIEADTANRNYTALDLGLTAGWEFNENLKGYAGYSAFLSDQDMVSSFHTLFVGLHQRITPTIMLVPQYRFTHYKEAHQKSITFASSRETQSLGLGAQIEVSPNTYVIPYVGFDHSGSYEDELNIKYHESDNGKTYAVSIYHSF